MQRVLLVEMHALLHLWCAHYTLSGRVLLLSHAFFLSSILHQTNGLSAFVIQFRIFHIAMHPRVKIFHTPTHHSFWLTSAGFFGLEAGVPGLLPFLLEEQKEVEGPKQTQTLWLTETAETLKLTNLGSTHFHYQTCRCCLRTWDVSSCNILQKRGQTQ